MANLDPEATGILIENGIDPATAVVGSITDEPQPPARPATHPRLVMILAVVAAVAAVILIRTF